jgi:hypothetical protein
MSSEWHRFFWLLVHPTPGVRDNLGLSDGVNSRGETYGGVVFIVWVDDVDNGSVVEMSSGDGEQSISRSMFR